MLDREDEANNVRGIILAGTIDVERMLDSFIADYFCGSIHRNKELLEWLLCSDRVTLDTKRQLFAKIVTTHYSNDLKPFETTLKRLENLVKHRNIFAHAELKISPDEDLVFIRYSSGKVTEKHYSKENIKEIRKDIIYICKGILKINQIVINQKRPL